MLSRVLLLCSWFGRYQSMLLKCHFLGTVLLRDHVCSIEYYYKFKGRSDELHLVLITCSFYCIWHCLCFLWIISYSYFIVYGVVLIGFSVCFFFVLGLLSSIDRFYSILNVENIVNQKGSVWCTLSKFVYSLIRNIDVEDGWTPAALILKNLIPLAIIRL